MNADEATVRFYFQNTLACDRSAAQCIFFFFFLQTVHHEVQFIMDSHDLKISYSTSWLGSDCLAPHILDDDDNAVELAPETHCVFPQTMSLSDGGQQKEAFHF